MQKEKVRVVIVGGGSAGWLTAGLIAAKKIESKVVSVTLIESPNKAILGVGEGTWPSMRSTLKKIGIDEAEFIQACDATYKQGSKFIGWQGAHNKDTYYHPFSLPEEYFHDNHEYYCQYSHAFDQQPFSLAWSTQAFVCEQFKAPKQKGTPPYGGVLNYGYHLDAVKFGTFLKTFCQRNLNVKHIIGHVESVIPDQNDYIESLQLDNGESVSADLFIDCSGFHARLIDKHYNIAFKSVENILFNDSALAIRIPVSPDSPIASVTQSTARNNGWIWDIGLPQRRGIGYVYASQFEQEQQAQDTLEQYIRQSTPHDSIEFKKFKFTPGYRKKFWHKNCVAIGVSSGFIEPLEASALAMIELSASYVASELTADKTLMSIASKRFNQRFTYRWERIIEFLKLHYILSEKPENYWQEHRVKNSIPTRLQESLKIWKNRPPSPHDFTDSEEVFPAASYQYVLSGMGFYNQHDFDYDAIDNELKHWLDKTRTRIEIKKKQLSQGLPSHRELIQVINNTIHQQ